MRCRSVRWGSTRLRTIPGMVPGIDDRPLGCLFNPRCAFRTESCEAERPALDVVAGGRARCLYPLDGQGRPTHRADMAAMAWRMC